MLSTLAGAPSLNALAAPALSALLADAHALRLGVSTMECGARVVDGGIDSRGGFEAGRRIAELCLATLGRVSLEYTSRFQRWRWLVQVATSQPVLACLGSQYAGWSLEAPGPHGKTFRALGSGPARAIACREPLFEELGYRDRSDSTFIVLEADRLPPETLALKVAADCGLQPRGLTLVVTPTGSSTGVVQIAARVVEVGLHKAHALGFGLEHIQEGLGSAPLPPPCADSLTAMGRTNDAILFGGELHLFVSSTDADAEQLANQLPSSASSDYGKPFAQVFADYQHDFFQIDPMLFSPARVAVTTSGSGRTFLGGAVDESLLDRSFSGPAHEP